ncbi:hypothetical protein SH528x_005303 [Novipirellula sp. SH528]|uniref:hypothetical protein n=1 Tax=Novipirellula sp. SH528 TaxID=3454466 RepID=UPI003FA04562
MVLISQPKCRQFEAGGQQGNAIESDPTMGGYGTKADAGKKSLFGVWGDPGTRD